MPFLLLRFPFYPGIFTKIQCIFPFCPITIGNCVTAELCEFCIQLPQFILELSETENSFKRPWRLCRWDLRIVEAIAEHDSGIRRLIGTLSRRPLKRFSFQKVQRNIFEIVCKIHTIHKLRNYLCYFYYNKYRGILQ